jgi:hypothetical protein
MAEENLCEEVPFKQRLNQVRNKRREMSSNNITWRTGSGSPETLVKRIYFIWKKRSSSVEGRGNSEHRNC